MKIRYLVEINCDGLNQDQLEERIHMIRDAFENTNANVYVPAGSVTLKELPIEGRTSGKKGK